MEDYRRLEAACRRRLDDPSPAKPLPKKSMVRRKQAEQTSSLRMLLLKAIVLEARSRGVITRRISEDYEE